MEVKVINTSEAEYLQFVRAILISIAGFNIFLSLKNPFQILKYAILIILMYLLLMNSDILLLI
jgi:hypothetical protein